MNPRASSRPTSLVDAPQRCLDFTATATGCLQGFGVSDRIQAQAFLQAVPPFDTGPEKLVSRAGVMRH